MKVNELHDALKPVSALAMFSGDEGKVISIQILKNEVLKEHITKVPALLLCITGEVVFENEEGEKKTLNTGDYVHIEPMVKHWVVANEDSQLVLTK
ncbi:MAG: cupin domain-containing protein [Crocinitomicaceae bacterium]